MPNPFPPFSSGLETLISNGAVPLDMEAPALLSDDYQAPTARPAAPRGPVREAPPSAGRFDTDLRTAEQKVVDRLRALFEARWGFAFTASPYVDPKTHQCGRKGCPCGAYLLPRRCRCASVRVQTVNVRGRLRRLVVCNNCDVPMGEAP